MEAGGSAAGNGGAETRRVSSRTAAAGGQRPDSGADQVLAGLLKGRPVSEVTAEEAYHFIQPHLEMDHYADPLENSRMNYQFQLLMSRLPLATLEELMVRSREDGLTSFRMNQIFGSYALRDWDKAMAWAAGQKDADNLRAGAIARIAHVDPERAAGLLEQKLLEGGGQSGIWEASLSLSATVARQGPEAFFKFLDTMPSPVVTTMMNTGVRNMPKEHMAAFIAQLNQRVEAGTMDESRVTGVMNQIVSTHPGEVRAWLDKMAPGQERARGEFNLAASLTHEGKSAEAEAMITSAMASVAGEEREFARQRLPELVQRDPRLAEKLVALLPEGQKLKPADAVGWMSQFYSRPDCVVDVARLFPSQEDRVTVLVESFHANTRKLNENDFRILAHRVESLGLTGDAAARTREALEAARVKATGSENGNRQ